MNALIFAAGIGSRLRPFTDSHPKALVEVGGIPMLHRVIDRVIAAGAESVTVNVHHFAEQITEYIATHDFGIDIRISDESDMLLDTAGGLLKAVPLIGEECTELLVHNADILTDLNLTSMLTAHRASDSDATLLCQQRGSTRSLYFDSDGRMHGWGNSSTGETRPATLDTSGQLPLSFGGVHIINLKNVVPVLREWMSQISGTPGRIVKASITPFYADTCTALNYRNYLPDEPFSWYDIGRPETLAAARAAYRIR